MEPFKEISQNPQIHLFWADCLQKKVHEGIFKHLVLNCTINWIEIISFQIKIQRVYNQNISIYNASKYIKVYTIYIVYVNS